MHIKAEHPAQVPRGERFRELKLNHFARDIKAFMQRPLHITYILTFHIHIGSTPRSMHRMTASSTYQ